MANPAATRISSLYVHIPFCAQKCAYCAFYSEAASGELINRYTAALVRELEMVAVELYVGRLDAGGELTGAYAIPMQPAGEGSGGSWTFEADTVPCSTSGLHGYTVRIMPFHVDAPREFLPGVITWADGA